MSVCGWVCLGVFVCVVLLFVGDYMRLCGFVSVLVCVCVCVWVVLCVSGWVYVGVCVGGMCVPCSDVTYLVAEV